MAELRYRGREIAEEDILSIRALIERYPKESRRKLSARICEAWQWRQANGALRDMVCRGMLLMLERAGQIALPPVSYVRHNPLAHRARPEPVLIDKTPIEDPLRNTAAAGVRAGAAQRAGAAVQQPDGGASLSWLRAAGGRAPEICWCGQKAVLSQCLAWSSAPRHLGSRDRYIGWDAAARRSRIRFIAYNTRFLILPWVRVEHLASHILGRMAARISDDWEQMYGHPIYFLETFIDPERFRGTCYRAANWVLTGHGRRAAASNRTVMFRTGRSRRSWAIR